MTEEAKTKALEEVDRMEKMPPIAPEVGVHSHLRRIDGATCPGTSAPRTIYDLNHAQEVLDDDHYALEKIKDRIVEFLAVRQLNPQFARPDFVLHRASGRGQNLHWQIHRQALWGANSFAFASAAFTTRPKCAAIAAPTSARCRAALSRPCAA